MTDAQALFRQGVTVLREHRDIAEGRRLLMESLRLEPQNEMAWVWLARTISQPEKRLQALDRALTINPENPQALEMKAALALPEAAPLAAANGAAPPPLKTAGHALTAREEKQIAFLMKKADHLLNAGDTEGAVEQWVEVLHIQVDHEEAMRLAVAHLARMNYMEDAQELVQRAIDAGTQHPSIYLTAIDIARRQKDFALVDALSEDFVRLPEVDDAAIVRIAEGFIAREEAMRARDLLMGALASRPESQPILTALGDLHEMMAEDGEARRYYEQAARLGARTRAGRTADKKLQNFTPVMTDNERGSLLLAWREAAGVGALYLFLAWHDAGLNLLSLGLTRWLGVALGLVGGYLVITATSSPQQRGLAALLGGHVPDEPIESHDATQEEATDLPIISPTIRLALGVVGAVLLLAGAAMIFHAAFELLRNPVPPTDIPSFEELYYGRRG